MNIHITQKEHEYLQSQMINKFIIGSKLYGINNKNSDTDWLCIYKWEEEFNINWSYLPNYHQFQYKDLVNNIDYIYTTAHQFIKNQQSGDSTINSDVILFDDMIVSKEESFAHCYTYKVIKGYIGFAKRDIKQCKEGKHKLIHAARGLYMAESILNKTLPTLALLRLYLQDLNDYSNANLRNFLLEKEVILRNRLKQLYDSGEIELYYLPKITQPTLQNKLIEKLFNSNNKKEFKY